MYRSRFRYQKITEFKLVGTQEEDSKVLMTIIDELTMGRMKFASCKTIERHVLEKEELVAVFFGGEEKLWNTGNYTHLVEAVAVDRARNMQEPMTFL